MTDQAALPDFAVAMRGYDRLQVDDYIVKQTVWLDEARSRMEAAEKELAGTKEELTELRTQRAADEEREFTSTPRSLEELGERVGRLLQMAWDSAEELRQDAEQQAAELVGQAEAKLAAADEEVEQRARRAEQEAETSVAERFEHLASEAEALIAESRRESEEILAQARREAELATEEARRRRDEVEVEITRLEEQRDSTMAELGRLRSALESLFSSLSPQGQADGPLIDLRTADPEPVTSAPRRRVQ